MIHENIRETRLPKICEPKPSETTRIQKVASRKRKYPSVRYRDVEAETIPSHSISQLPLYLANSDLSVDEIGTEMQEKSPSSPWPGPGSRPRRPPAQWRPAIGQPPDETRRRARQRSPPLRGDASAVAAGCDNLEAKTVSKSLKSDSKDNCF
jgi:hypothetical protein